MIVKDAYLLGLGGLGGLLLTGLGVGLPLLEESLGDENVVSRGNGAVGTVVKRNDDKMSAFAATRAEKVGLRRKVTAQQQAESIRISSGNVDGGS